MAKRSPRESDRPCHFQTVALNFLSDDCVLAIFSFARSHESICGVSRRWASLHHQKYIKAFFTSNVAAESDAQELRGILPCGVHRAQVYVGQNISTQIVPHLLGVLMEVPAVIYSIHMERNAWDLDTALCSTIASLRGLRQCVALRLSISGHYDDFGQEQEYALPQECWLEMLQVVLVKGLRVFSLSLFSRAHIKGIQVALQKASLFCPAAVAVEIRLRGGVISDEQVEGLQVSWKSRKFDLDFWPDESYYDPYDPFV